VTALAAPDQRAPSSTSSTCTKLEIASGQRPAGGRPRATSSGTCRRVTAWAEITARRSRYSGET
jgi:hypothetical protein